MDDALPGETRGEGYVHTREHPTVKTEVPVAADAATAGPTSDLPKGGGEGVEEPIDDEWCFPVKAKKKVARTDEWGVPVKKKKI
jgi:hypothetical protein